MDTNKDTNMDKNETYYDELLELGGQISRRRFNRVSASGMLYPFTGYKDLFGLSEDSAAVNRKVDTFHIKNYDGEMPLRVKQTIFTAKDDFDYFHVATCKESRAPYNAAIIGKIGHDDKNRWVVVTWTVTQWLEPV